MAFISMALSAIMIAQIAGSVAGAIPSAKKAGQQQCKIQSQIGEYSSKLDSITNELNDAKKAVSQGGEVTGNFKSIAQLLATMRQNTLDKQNEIIGDYKKEITKINIISLSFIATVFIMMLVNCILKNKKRVNC